MADNERNPRNSSSELFRKLTRIFSGPIVGRRTQAGRRIKKREIDKFASTFKSASGQQFKKSQYNPFESMQSNMMAQQDRAERYKDFDAMEYTPEIASALDIYADEMTTSSQLTRMLAIDCQNEEIKEILNSLFHNILNVEFNLFGWSRSMCKFGDFFLYLDIDETLGIKAAVGLPSNEVERLEGEDKTNPNYVQYQWNAAGMTFENWQIAHFRILGNDKWSPYGTSVLEPARRIWRQLTLMEDAMMAYRIVRAPERRIFYVDVGNIAPQDVEQYMQRVMTQMKRNQVVDSHSGRVDVRYNPLSVEEDIFIPTRGDTKFATVENLPGGQHASDIDDVKYLRDKLFAALKVPQSYLTLGEGGEEDKSTLAQKDIRFARTIQRLQRALVSEIEKIGIVHLYTLGYRGDDLIGFKLSLNNPSKLAELQELEHWRTKFDTAASATEGFFSRRWVAKNMFGLSEDDFLRNQREMFYDRKFDAELNAIAEIAGEEMAAGGMGALPGDDMGALPGDEPGEELPAPEELGELPPEGALGGEEAPAAGEETLLATPAPAKRDTDDRKRRDPTTTTRSKGKWYKPVVSDQRKFRVPQRKNIRTGANLRFNRDIPGAKDLIGLGKMTRIYEDLFSIYNMEEDLKGEKDILNASNDAKFLIESLNKMEPDTDET